MDSAPWSDHGNDDAFVDHRRRNMYRASTAPAQGMGFPIVPLALMPGQTPQSPTLDTRNNFYFPDATRMYIPHDVRSMPIPQHAHHTPLYPAHMANHFQVCPRAPTGPSQLPPPRPPLPPAFSDPHPVSLRPRSLTSLPPPVPPKPFAAPALPPKPRQGDYNPHNGLYTVPEPAVPGPPNPPDDQGEIAMALALSASVTQEAQQTRQTLVSQEEEDLARAMEASLLESRNPILPTAFVNPSSYLATQNLIPKTVNNIRDHEDMVPGIGKPSEVSHSDHLPHYYHGDSYAAGEGNVSQSVSTLVQSSPQTRHSPLSGRPTQILEAYTSGPNIASTSNGDNSTTSTRIYTIGQGGRNAFTSMASETQRPQYSKDPPSIFTNSEQLPQYPLGNRTPPRKDSRADDQSIPQLLATRENSRPAPAASEPFTQNLEVNTGPPKYSRLSTASHQVADAESRPSSHTQHHVSAPMRPSEVFTSTSPHSSYAALHPPRYSSSALAPAHSTDFAPEGMDVVAAHATTTLPTPAYHADGMNLESGHNLIPATKSPSAVVSDAPQSSSGSLKSSQTSNPLPSNTQVFTPPTQRLQAGSLSPPGRLSRISSMASISDQYHNDDRPGQGSSTAMSFVEQELFNGVSVGFQAPIISSQLVPMLNEMPPIISLPYGKARPLHLQGPSWRHLLKLLARLSGTRVEPALEAVAAIKTSPKLRTVVQFAKPQLTSTVWRTILYFTIDYPSPPELARGRSVNELPYSYSLAGVPTLLRGAADTPTSKTFTIPATDSFPYPTLPITFPELALYLQAALEVSRRWLNDNSSDNRKLAKMVKLCYPADDVPPNQSERSSVGGLFKRFIGRSERPNRRGGNEDTYELFTPFVSDEWG